MKVRISDLSSMITTSRFFEWFIIVVICLNCVTLADTDSTVEETEMEKNIDLAFNIIYTIEMFLRIFSLGFVFNKNAYLRQV